MMVQVRLASSTAQAVAGTETNHPTVGSSRRKIPVVRFALCIGHRGKEWEVLLGYGGAALRCDGKIWDVLGTGGWAQVVQLTSVARVVGKQILKEVGLKLLLHFTDQSTE